MSERISERIKKGARIGFFGLGKSNLSLLSSLPLEKCSITLRSDKPISLCDIPVGITPERILVGEHSARDIDEDILIFAPSVRRDRQEFKVAERKCIKFSSDLEIFLEENTRPLFSVSGSDGKSTTATLISMLIPSSRLIGNIGVPMTAELNTNSDMYVAELSSFMLTYAKVHSKRACITNITPNHLNWHSDFSEYRNTKLSLLDMADECVIDGDDDALWEYKKAHGIFGIASDRQDFSVLRGSAEVIMTRTEQGIEKNGVLIIPSSDLVRWERHNVKNLMLALIMAHNLASDEQIRNTVRDFKGLCHRCERFAIIKGAEYINSSIDSTPARTIATLDSLDRRVILLLGGKSKGISYEGLCYSVQKYASRVLIFGENREEIFSAIKGYAECEVFQSLADATHRAVEIAKIEDTVLLSPASTSYDAFTSFEERGDLFKKIILEYKTTTF